MGLSIKKRHPIKKKEARRYIEHLSPFYSSLPDFDLKSFEIASGDGVEVLLYMKEPALFIIDSRPIPAIQLLLKYPPDRRWVTVDMGAVKFLTNGADVMAPGIVDADPGINRDDVVWVREEKHSRPLCIGVALMAGEEMVNARSGKAIESLHYVGDRLWELFK